MNNKIFIIVEVPLIESKYEVYIPVGKTVNKVSMLFA